jgi:DNA repair protein RecO (recombination protein O)
MTENLHAAFVLHRKPYSDSSLLLELFCSQSGRQPVIAKGARRSSRQNSFLQPFVPLWLAWRGKGEVKTLTTAEQRGEAPRLVGKRLYCAMYINELVARLTPRGEAPDALFQLYEHALDGLASEQEIEPLLRGFELQLLDNLGYGLLLTHTAEAGEPLRPDAMYEFEPLHGAVDASASSGTCYSGATLLAMAHRDFSDPEVRRQALQLMRRIIDFHLGYRALKSRELFRQTF